MSDFPPLAEPWSRVALVHSETDLFDPETMAALDQRYLERGAIPIGTDLNGFGTTGLWRGHSLVNAPGGSSAWFYYDIHNHNGAYLRQTAYNFFDPTDVSNRIRDNGVWSPWRRFAFV